MYSRYKYMLHPYPRNFFLKSQIAIFEAGLQWLAYEGFNLGGERALTTLSSKEEKVIPNKHAIT